METKEDLETKLDNEHALTSLRGAGLPSAPSSGPASSGSSGPASSSGLVSPSVSVADATGARASRNGRARGSGSAWLGSLVGLGTFAAASAVAAIAGGLVTTRRQNKGWYRALRKPSFTPPDRVFGLVWPVLYTLGTLSAWRVARAPASRERNLALGLWGTQLAFNAAWAPIFFGAHRPRLAMADVAANYVSLGGYALAARKVDPTAAWMVVPYLGWVTFAGTLNAGIIAKNRGPIARLLARG